MFGIWGRSAAVVVPAVAALVLLAAPRNALADGTESAPEAGQRGTLFGLAGPQAPASASTDLTEGAGLVDWSQISFDRVWSADYHPETDRWTERNNRVKISIYGAGLFFSQNLRITHDAGVGLRLAWEVPGFIGIRLDSVIDPFSSRMRIRLPSGGNDSTRTMDGYVDCTSLSIAIFNPELSYPANLAMWAGFGFDVWFYHYADRGINQGNQAVHYIDQNVGLNFFFDLEYKITDIFHVGIGFREHGIYAPQTEVGEFYHINGHQASNNHHNRNNTRPWDLAAVEEIQLSASILF